MDILQVAPYYPPYEGGQENHVQGLTRYLRQIGHEVRVLTSDYPPDEAGQRDDSRVSRLPVRARALRNPIVSPSSEMLSLFRWADIVHTHNEHAWLSNIAALVGTTLAKPMVLTCHGQLSFGSPVKDAVESLYNRTLGTATLKAMDRVIALSETDREYLQSLGLANGSVEVVPNAIEPPEPIPDTLVEQVRDRHDLHGRRVVLFVGPIVRRKSPETLLRAMPRIRERHPDALALFVGSGDYLEATKAEAEALGLDRAVGFTGYLPDRELLAAYRAGSVLAVPSVSEGLPTTIMEAMIHELPVVATELGPIEDWFEDHALLIESDPDPLARAVTRILSDDNLARRLGRDGAELVRKRLTWDTVAQEVSQVYTDIVGIPPTSQDRDREQETVAPISE